MGLIDITVCLPIYYGAKIADVEKCLDSLYTACENIDKKYKNKVINFLIGMDNCPKKFDTDKSVQRNKTEIKNRIVIFQNAIKSLNNNFDVSYFITENNVRVSVMRNIMISKTQNSKYITFSDHDDNFDKNAFNTLFSNIEKNTNAHIMCFKCFNAGAQDQILFEYLGPWSILYSPKYLLENNISFIPDIPLEDRFFRRECDTYTIKEEIKDINDYFYIHNKEGRSGLLPSDLLALIRQEVVKRSCYKGIKIKNYMLIRRGLDEKYYSEYVFNFDEKNSNANYLLSIMNYNKILDKAEANEFQFSDGKKLNRYPKDNQYTFCKILYNDNEEIYCRGYLSNKEFNNILNFNLKRINEIINYLEYNSNEFIVLLKFIDKYISNNELQNILNDISKDNANEVLTKLIKRREEYILKLINDKNYSELENILNIQDKNIDLSFIQYEELKDEKVKDIINNYIFNVAFEAINTENYNKTVNIINRYPQIIKICNKYNKVNLANLSCRKQTIYDVENDKNDFINSIKDNNNKILAFILAKFPESFLERDIYGKCGLDFLLIDYVDSLSFNNPLTQDNIKEFFVKVDTLSKIFNEDFYQVIPYLRFILNKKIEYNDKENILKQCDSIKKDFLKDDLIGINISRFFNDKNYDLLKQTLIVKNDISGVNILLPNYIKYTTFINIFEYKDKDNKTVLDYTKEDEKFKEFIREFLIKTIWINFLNIVNIDPINKYNIVRTKQAIEILFDKNNNFREYKIDFKKYLDEFFKKSKILTSLKLTQELHDKISDNKIILEKKEQKKFSKIYQNSINKLPNSNEVLTFFNNINDILFSNVSDLEKINNFLDLVDNILYIINNKNK